MSTQIWASSAAAPKHGAKVQEVVRKTAVFHPSIWGDRFLNYSPEDPLIHAQKEHQIRELKEEVRRQLMAISNEPSQQLNLIDAIQRLGVAYHFEKEIEEALQHIYKTYQEIYADEYDLHNVSLLFRLQRQEGFDISCDVFNKFKDDKGKLKESLSGDLKGMLSLYEAAHLSKHGDDHILEEAMTFTITHLTPKATPGSSNPLTTQIDHALKQSLHRGVPRLEARQFISIYEQYASHNKALLKLAKLDFNQLQSLHKKELSEITRWWKDLNFANKLPYARDRVVECYFWILGVYFEPKYCLARKISSKVIAITSIIDDTYDAYGTIEELEQFTEAVERWNINCKDQLPDYMKLCYQALLDVYEEIEEAMVKRGQSYSVYYAKEAMKRLVKAYFIEAKWMQEDRIPTMEEYMANALVTGAYYMLATTSFVGMGEIATKEAFDWMPKDPKIVTASSTICRLMDDIVSHKFEQERGHVASAIECYMKEYNVTENQAKDELLIGVANAWKDINEELLRPTIVPMPLLTRVLNFARVINVLYKFEDGYTHVGTATKTYITSLLIDRVPR